MTKVTLPAPFYRFANIIETQNDKVVDEHDDGVALLLVWLSNRETLSVKPVLPVQRPRANGRW